MLVILAMIVEQNLHVQRQYTPAYQTLETKSEE